MKRKTPRPNPKNYRETILHGPFEYQVSKQYRLVMATIIFVWTFNLIVLHPLRLWSFKSYCIWLGIYLAVFELNDYLAYRLAKKSR